MNYVNNLSPDFKIDAVGGNILTKHARKRIKERGTTNIKIRAENNENIIVTVLPKKKKPVAKQTVATLKEEQNFLKINNKIICNGRCKQKKLVDEFSKKELKKNLPKCLKCISAKEIKCNGKCQIIMSISKFSKNQQNNINSKCKKCVSLKEKKQNNQKCKKFSNE